MSILTQSEPASRPRTRTRSIQVFPSDELTDFSTFGLTNEQIGVLTKLRLCCWHRGGLPNTEESITTIRKELLRISPRKFQKIWGSISVFFTETDGSLYYTADEERRLEHAERTAKSQESGKIGAEKRWNKAQKELLQPNGVAILSDMATFPSHPIPSENLSLNLEEEAAAVPSSRARSPEAQPPETAAGPTAGLQDLGRAVNDQDYQELALRSIELGMQAPDRVTAVKILQRFPTIKPNKFPLFKNQNSPGLWLFKHQIDMELEITRQEFPAKKPSTIEDPVLRQWAKDIDRKAGR